jgi:hypothetical protein
MLMDKLHELQSCNSSYIQCNSLQLYQNDSFSTTMQLHYNCTRYDMLTSLIIIHSFFNVTRGIMNFFDIKLFSFRNINPLFIMIVNDGLKL